MTPACYTEAMPIIITAIILGLLEGLTEFLPISSTGHLIVAQRVLNFHDVQDVFTVVIQLGAIAAVVWFYRHDLWSKIIGLFKRDKAALRFWLILVVGTVPAGLIGLALDKHMQAITTPRVVAWALIIGGVILWLVDRKPVPRRAEAPQLEQVSLKQAVLIGLGQCLAIVPGVSRSGATIVSGLATGLNRATATAFSFYLSIPVLVLASGYKLAAHPDAISQVSGGPAGLIVGLIAAFITALLSVAWLLRYISRHNFRPFAYYRVILGVIILLFL